MAKAKVGRPRSEVAQEAIIKATHELLNEEGGAGLTIEAIAKRAKVGKPTIYRWWPSLADIVLEVVLQQADKRIPVPEYTSLAVTLGEYLQQAVAALDWGGEHLRFLMAHAQKDEAFRERFREHYVAQRRAALSSILVKAQESGELSRDLSAEFVVDMVFGAMWYRLLTGHAPVDDIFAANMASVFMKLCDKAPQ